VGVLPKEEGQRDGCCRADKALRVRVQRSVGSSSRVREMKKNLAYQPARDPLIWAAYMPRKVGPLGGPSLIESQPERNPIGSPSFVTRRSRSKIIGFVSSSPRPLTSRQTSHGRKRAKWKTTSFHRRLPGAISKEYTRNTFVLAILWSDSVVSCRT